MATRVYPPGGGIYAITNSTNGKQYLGSAIDFRMRWNLHRFYLRRGTHHSGHLQAAWRKYGASSFTFTVLETIADPTCLIEREQWYLDQRYALKGSHEYNILAQAGSPLGIKRTAATRARLSQWRTGRKLTGAELDSALRALEQARLPENQAKGIAKLRTMQPTARQLAYRARLREETARRNKERGERIKANRTEKLCKLCGQVKPIGEFRVVKKRQDWHHVVCRACEYDYNRQNNAKKNPGGIIGPARGPRSPRAGGE